MHFPDQFSIQSYDIRVQSQVKTFFIRFNFQVPWFMRIQRFPWIVFIGIVEISRFWISISHSKSIIMVYKFTSRRRTPNIAVIRFKSLINTRWLEYICVVFLFSGRLLCSSPRLPWWRLKALASLWRVRPERTSWSFTSFRIKKIVNRNRITRVQQNEITVKIASG